MESIGQGQKKGYGYARVSSRRQFIEGNGLPTQVNICRTWIENKNHKVMEIFTDAAQSGGKRDREGLDKLLDIMRKSKESLIIVVSTQSRFARDFIIMEEITATAFKYNHDLYAVDKGKFENTPSGRLLTRINAVTDQYQREINAETAKNNMNDHMKRGYWVVQPPVGYKVKRIDKLVHLERDEPVASIIQDALEGFAAARFITIKDVCQYIQRRKDETGAQMAKPGYNFVNRILNTALYTGYAEYKLWGIPYQKWEVEPLVSLETYDRIQKRLGNRFNKVKGRTYNMNDEKYPLKPWMLCAHCGRMLTASASTGCMKVRYEYYHCTNKACKVRFKPQDIHQLFEAVLDDITPKKRVLDLASTLMKNLYEGRAKDYYAAVEANKRRVKEIEGQQEQLLQNAARTSIEVVRVGYENQYARLEEEKVKLGADVEGFKDELIPFSEAWGIISAFIGNPKRIWQAGNHRLRVLVRNLCFSEPISLGSDKKFRTIKKSPLFAAFEQNEGDNLMLARPAGFELATF